MYKPIPDMWRRLNNLLPRMTGDMREQIGPIVVERNRILLPSGLYLNYHRLRYENGNWVFEYGGITKKIYGGAMLENIIQALARICNMDAAVRIRNRIGRCMQLQVHDELVYVVPDEVAKAVKAIVMEEMRRPPSWGPDIPLDVEANTGRSYGECE